MIKYSERDFKKLYNSIMMENRYIYNDEVKEIISRIIDFFNNRVEVISINRRMYRAQKGCKEYNPMPVPYEKDRMLPLDYEAREGRANPKGISYVYLSNKDYIAVSEVRSWLGDELSLAEFSNMKELKLVDFSSDDESPLIVDFDSGELYTDNTMDSLWAEINQSFSRPVMSTDNKAEYALTQMIAECVKNSGYDGLFYNSGFSKPDKEGKNVVIFDKNLLKLHKVSVVEIKGFDVKFEECTNPAYYYK